MKIDFYELWAIYFVLLTIIQSVRYSRVWISILDKIASFMLILLIQYGLLFVSFFIFIFSALSCDD